MEPKIPLFCISNMDKENNSILYKIKCLYCKGVFYDPVYSKIDNCIYCKDCFYKVNNIDKNEEQDIGKLYNKLEKKEMDYLYKFNYYCPLCLKNNNNNNNKNSYNRVAYTYDALMLHLIICDNQIIFNNACHGFLCNNIINIYLKDINEQENISDIILANQTLEKEIEKELLNINYKDYSNYLKLQLKKKNKEDNKKNINIKNELLNKKRKQERQEKQEKQEKQENTVKKNNVNKNKNNDCKNKSNNKINNKSNNNCKSSNNLFSTLRGLEKLLFDKPYNNEIQLVNICPHWKGTYKLNFLCCNKEYGCEECHFLHESHDMLYTGDVLCLNCNNIYKGNKCPFCNTEKIKRRIQI